MRTALYVRVSSDEQAGHGTSLTTQRKFCEAYAHSQGMQVVYFFEEDFSGRFLDRPQLNRLRVLIQSGEVDGLVVHAIDRYTREPAHLEFLVEELLDHNIELHTVSGKQDIHTPEGRMYLGVQAQFGRLWWQKIRESSMRARDHIKQNGGYYGTAGPYGYRVGGEKLKYYLEIYEPEAEVVRLIFQYLDEGLGSMLIANKLTSLGYKPQRKGKWHPAYIVHIARNPAYKGTYPYRFKMVKGKRITLPEDQWQYIDCPEIVTPELWDRANVRLTMTGKRFIRKHFFVMAGRLTCSCGYAVTAYPDNTRKSGGYYGCNGRKVVKNGCKMPYLQIHEVDNSYWDWVVGLLTDPDAKLAAIERYQQSIMAQLEPLKQEVARLSVAMDKLKKRLKGYEEMCADGDLTRAAFKEHKAEIDAQISVLSKDYEGAQAKLDTVQMPGNIKERLFSLFEKLKARPEILTILSNEEKHSILADFDLFGSLVLEDGIPALYIKWYGYTERCNVIRRNLR